MRYLAPMFALFLLGAATGAEDAAAQPYRAREGVQNGQVRPLDQILNGIRRQRPGNLADVEGPNFGPEGDARYRLKWVSPDGRVQWLDTDARTGRVLGVEGDERGGPGPNRPGFNPNSPPNPRGNFDPRGTYGPRGGVPRNQGYEGLPDGSFDDAPPPNFGRGFRRGPGGFDGGPNGPGGPGGPGGRFENRPNGGFNPGGGFNRGGGGFDRGDRGGGGGGRPRGFGRYGR